MNADQPRPSRRTLGLPGQARPDEWQESAYATEPAHGAPDGADDAAAAGEAAEQPHIPAPAAEPAAERGLRAANQLLKK